MASVKEADSQKLIIKAAERLKKMPGMEKPGWAVFVKTGPSRERPPEQADWWWIRGASMLRKIYLGDKGVSKLRKAYSGRKNLGHRPEHRFPASGKIIRTLLRQLEVNNLVKTEKGRGRIITPAGQKFLDGIAKEVRKE
jgi:small subunit ribosomal protein S19e